MKKIVALILALLMGLSFAACAENNDDSNNMDNNTSNSSSTSKIKLLGDIIPRPMLDYDVINSSDESVYLEIENATEEDFRAYVDSCRSYGFDGEIMSATMPDLYYREYNEDNYFLEVRFMKEDQNFSVYVRTPIE